MSRVVKSFFVKLLIIALPFFILICIYLFTDPYRVLYHYDNYYAPRESQYVALNRDYISTEMLIRNYPVYYYDSYIFGNSRSYFYSVKQWSKLINSDRCFHYNSNAESLYGLVQKLKYLDSQNFEFRHALFVIDIPLLEKTTPDKGPIFLKHPIYTNQSRLDFQLEFVKAFFDPRFLYAFIDMKISHKWKPYMKLVLSDKFFNYEIKTNELSMKEEEEKIKADSIGYYRNKLGKNIFFKRAIAEKMAAPVIHQEQEKLLEEAADILRRHKIDFRLIISPVYDQQKLNVSDITVLRRLFGKENVFDFSGKNNITEQVGNYYENSHYRPNIASRLMEIAYSKQATYN